MTAKLLIGAGLVIALLAVLAWGLWQRSGKFQAEANARVAIAAQVETKAALDHLYAIDQQKDAALLAHAETIHKIESEMSALQAQKQEAIKNDQEYATWRNMPTPAALQRMHQ